MLALPPRTSPPVGALRNGIPIMCADLDDLRAAQGITCDRRPH